MSKQEVNDSSVPQLSKRLEGISESATLKLNATVQAMKNQGVDVVNLTAGEPDFHVPDAAKEAVIASLKANRSKYTPVPGIPELRQAIADKTNKQQVEIGRTNPWKASNVVVANGGKQCLFNSFLAVLDPGDEVLIPSPFWLSYPEMVRIAGGIPKLITAPYSQGFKIKPEQLKAAIGPRVKMLVLNSPSNPTGVMYSKSEYAALAEVLLNTPGAEKIWVVSDEIYDRIVLGDRPFCSFLDAAPALRNRTITVNGMSKSAAMTGWRIGWSVASENVTQTLITLQGQSTSGINSLAQWASLAALQLPEAEFASQVNSYRLRRDLMLENLRKASKIELVSPDGAFYIFVGVGKYLKPGEDSIAFAQRLLEEAKVATVPGTPFGEPEFLRLSFATDEKSIQEGCKRLMNYLNSESSSS
jgi:aspartate aminotransferase